MLKRDERELIEKRKNSGDFALIVDVDKLADVDFDLYTVSDVINAYNSFLHITGDRDGYKRFKEMALVNITDFVSELENGKKIKADIPPDYKNEYVILSRGKDKKLFYSIGRVIREKDGIYLEKVSPLDLHKESRDNNTNP